jgi:hypothetical protein
VSGNPRIPVVAVQLRPAGRPGDSRFHKPHNRPGCSTSNRILRRYCVSGPAITVAHPLKTRVSLCSTVTVQALDLLSVPTQVPHRRHYQPLAQRDSTPYCSESNRPTWPSRRNARSAVRSPPGSSSLEPQPPPRNTCSSGTGRSRLCWRFHFPPPGTWCSWHQKENSCCDREPI